MAVFIGLNNDPGKYNSITAEQAWSASSAVGQLHEKHACGRMLISTLSGLSCHRSLVRPVPDSGKMLHSRPRSQDRRHEDGQEPPLWHRLDEPQRGVVGALSELHELHEYRSSHVSRTMDGMRQDEYRDVMVVSEKMVTGGEPCQPHRRQAHQSTA